MSSCHRWAACLGAALFLLVLLVATEATAGPTEESSAELLAFEAAEGQRLAASTTTEVRPKVFDFKQFKALFHKTYASVSEELHRQKLFLANLLKSFTSYFKYKHKRASWFMAVNEMSDWTPGEYQESFMKPQVLLERMAAAQHESADDDEEQEDDEGEVEAEGSEKSESTTRTSLGALMDDEDEDDDDDQFRAVLGKHLERLNAHKEENIEQIVALELNDLDEREDQQVEPTPVEIVDLPEHPEKRPKKGINLGRGVRVVGKKIGEGLKKGFEITDAFLQDNFRRFYARKPEYRPDLPDETFVDHRDSGCLSTAKSQARCGSCYIFSTMALYEWAYCKQKGIQRRFSEQYVLDCGHSLGIKGCEGGFMWDVAKFVGKFGLELEERSKYRGRSRECPFNVASKDYHDTMGLLRLDEPKLSFVGVNKIERQLEVSPIIIVLFITDEIHQYGGGVYDGKNCGKDWWRLHAVLLVGHGRQDGHEFWIIRNSWGHWYGEDGYLRVRKDSRCVADFGSGLTLKRLKIRKKRAWSLRPKARGGQESNSSAEVASDTGAYKFSENPNYDWRALAEKSHFSTHETLSNPLA